jgi:hypothetical protein
MSKRELITTSDVWFASVLTYLGYELAYVTAIDSKKCSYTIQCASLDYEDLERQYYTTGDLALGDARSFVNAFNRLIQNQRAAQREGGTWTNPRWVSGEIDLGGGMIAGDNNHRLIQIGETAVRNDSNVACERTFDRIERLKAEEQMRPKAAPTDLLTEAYQREQQAKENAKQAEKTRVEAAALVRGDYIVVDGTAFMRANSKARWEPVQNL